MFASRAVPNLPRADKHSSAQLGTYMRKAITLLELAIGSALAIAVVAYMGQGAILMTELVL